MSRRGLCRDGPVTWSSVRFSTMVVANPPRHFPGLGGSGQSVELFLPPLLRDLRPKLSLSPSLVSELDFFNPLNTLKNSIVMQEHPHIQYFWIIHWVEWGWHLSPAFLITVRYWEVWECFEHLISETNESNCVNLSKHFIFHHSQLLELNWSLEPVWTEFYLLPANFCHTETRMRRRHVNIPVKIVISSYLTCGSTGGLGHTARHRCKHRWVLYSTVDHRTLYTCTHT